MHVLGKICLWLSLVLILVAVVLSTLALSVRSKWQAEIEARREKLADSADQLMSAQLRVRALDDEYQRQVSNWGQVWTADRSNPQPGSAGIVELGAGLSSGLGATTGQGEKPTLFVFATTPEGASRFLGEFLPGENNADRTAAQLVRTPFPGEVDSWPAGTYRVRNLLPANWLSTIARINSDYLVTSSRLRSQQLQRDILNNQIAASETILAQRMAELNGDPEAPAGADQEVVLGLVETIRQAETDRNLLLQDVQNLRRELDRRYVHLRETLATIQVISSQMEQAAGLNSDATPLQTTSTLTISR